MQNALQVLEKFLSTHAHFFLFIAMQWQSKTKNKQIIGGASTHCLWALLGAGVLGSAPAILCLLNPLSSYHWAQRKNQLSNFNFCAQCVNATTDKNSVLAQLSYVHDACRTSRYCSITRTLTCKNTVILITRLVVVRCLYTSDMVRLPIWINLKVRL